MKKLFIFIAVCALGLTLLFFRSPQIGTGIKIGIVLPIQHDALDDIVAGFESELLSLMKDLPFTIEIANALGDINLQRSAISKFLNEKVDLLVPVTTATAQMSLQLAAQHSSILFLAADIPANSATARDAPNLMGVNDEISVARQLNFIQATIPEIQYISIIYSSSDKVFKDVKEFAKLAQREGIVVQQLMIQNLSELYTVSQRLSSKSQALFILKDNIVASGISALVNQANKLKIPFISSDEGTVKNGAAYALGVVEADIGKQGARIAAAYLRGDSIEGGRIQQLGNISVFINKSACGRQGILPSQITQSAENLALTVHEIGG